LAAAWAFTLGTRARGEGVTPSAFFFAYIPTFFFSITAPVSTSSTSPFPPPPTFLVPSPPAQPARYDGPRQSPCPPASVGQSLARIPFCCWPAYFSLPAILLVFHRRLLRPRRHASHFQLLGILSPSPCPRYHRLLCSSSLLPFLQHPWLTSRPGCIRGSRLRCPRSAPRTAPRSLGRPFSQRPRRHLCDQAVSPHSVRIALRVAAMASRLAIYSHRCRCHASHADDPSACRCHCLAARH
jgi:hypothetical protein